MEGGEGGERGDVLVVCGEVGVFRVCGVQVQDSVEVVRDVDVDCNMLEFSVGG